MRECGFLPWQIDAMTLPEITVLLEGLDQERQTHEQIAEQLNDWRRLTPRERLLSQRRHG